MSKAIQCDRCKRFEGKADHRQTREQNLVSSHPAWSALYTGEDVAMGNEAMHLCPNCTRAFLEFMKQPPESG